MILALDPATTVGWAAGEPGSTPQWGSRRFDGKATGQVVGMFRHWFNQRCYDLHPTLVVFEAPYVPRPGAAVPMNPAVLRRLLGIVATIEACCWELRIRCNEVTTLEASRFFIGTQRLKRDEKKLRTIETCRHYGWNVDNDNEADALAIWAMAECSVDPQATLRRGSGPLFMPKQPNAPPTVADRGALLFPPPDGGSDGRVAR